MSRLRGEFKMRSFRETLPLTRIENVFDTTAEEDFLREVERTLRGNSGDASRQDNKRD